MTNIGTPACPSTIGHQRQEWKEGPRGRLIARLDDTNSTTVAFSRKILKKKEGIASRPIERTLSYFLPLGPNAERDVGDAAPLSRALDGAPQALRVQLLPLPLAMAVRLYGGKEARRRQGVVLNRREHPGDDGGGGGGAAWVL